MKMPDKIRDDEYVYCYTCSKMCFTFHKQEHRHHRIKVFKGKLRTNSREGILKKYGFYKN